MLEIARILVLKTGTSLIYSAAFQLTRRRDAADSMLALLRDGLRVFTPGRIGVHFYPDILHIQPGLTHLISSISTRLFEFRLEKLCAIFERQSQRTQ
jgi:hypothetical protein